MIEEKGLEKVFSSPIRLRVMASLMSSQTISFSNLLAHLEVTRGNLSSHVKALEMHKMLKIKKDFVANKPKTTYTITEVGKRSFIAYVTLLTSILSATKGTTR